LLHDSKSIFSHLPVPRFPNGWGFHQGFSTAGEPGAEARYQRIQSFLQRAKNFSLTQNDEAEFSQIVGEFFAPGARNDGFQTGIEVGVDLSRLVTGVVIGPAEELQQSRSKAVVEAVAKELGIEITCSTLLSKPY
jgi:hypothetical protein